MNSKLLIPLIFVFSFQVNGQSIPPDPVPDCNEIQRVGTQHASGYLTRNWVGSFGINNTDCEFFGINVSGPMYPGDFAYGIVDVDQFIQSTPEEVDFSVDLTGVFQSLPAGEDVTIVELLSSTGTQAQIILRKNVSLAASSKGKGGQNTSPYTWLITIRWFDPANNNSVTEDSFVYQDNTEASFNYLWDDSEPSAPVSLISLGGNRVSVSPYTGNSSTGGGLVAVDINSANHEVTQIHFGLIDSSVLLQDGDRIVFHLNIPSNGGVSM